MTSSAHDQPSDQPADQPAGLALVTGASTGIGLELAREYVEHGFAVVVVADEPAIGTAAAELSAAGGQVTPVQADLTRPEEVERVWRETTSAGVPVTDVVLNAGVGVGGGTFAETALEDHLGLVDLNVRSTVHLAKLAVDHMVPRGAGRILVTSSVAATAPTPYQATYGASKSFGHSFAEGIREELKGTGVTVTSLMPGPTDTEFFDRAGMTDTPVAQGPKDDPADVAEDGFEALMKGKPHVVAGSFKNRALAEVATHLPDRVGTKAMGAQMKPTD